MKLVLDDTTENGAVREGGDMLRGYVEIVEFCLVGYQFTVYFEGWCLISDRFRQHYGFVADNVLAFRSHPDLASTIHRSDGTRGSICSRT